MVALVENKSDTPPARYSHYRLGMLVALAATVMLFTSLTSAYIVRASTANDWSRLPVPPLLWLSTALILTSSATLEIARRGLQHARLSLYRRWLAFTTALGFAFLVSQITVWRQLSGQGIYIDSNPHSSFFYLLTAAHGLHLGGGLLGLLYLLIRYRSQTAENVGRPLAAAGAVGIYWHFMDALWIYLFLLLFLWK